MLADVLWGLWGLALCAWAGWTAGDFATGQAEDKWLILALVAVYMVGLVNGMRL